MEQLPPGYLNLTSHFCPIETCYLKLHVNSVKVLFPSGKTPYPHLPLYWTEKVKINGIKVAPIEALHMITSVNFYLRFICFLPDYQKQFRCEILNFHDF